MMGLLSHKKMNVLLKGVPSTLTNKKAENRIDELSVRSQRAMSGSQQPYNSPNTQVEEQERGGSVTRAPLTFQVWMGVRIKAGPLNGDVTEYFRQ
ncbi:hypothetical protein RRF57_009738 [Xylaria bambusicola]|uniref:Uncharacterized protein n=1 Tax=Xylaria bambusicola TaxID=326684 RepID=A0AAN7V2Y1_9PEZI